MQKALDLFQRIASDLISDEKSKPVSDYVPSKRLYEQLDLVLRDNPISEKEFEEVLREVVFASPRTATPSFFNQLFGGRNEKAILGELLSVLLNNSMYTYKAGGASVGVEKSVLREACNTIGWGEDSDGTFASGGSLTNFMAMLMARDTTFQDVRKKGMHTPITVYTSEESHYSIPKNAAFCGIGRDQVRFIATDKKGKMIPQELICQIEEDINDGYVPSFLNLTAGTTVLGAFDSIEALLPIAIKYNIWTHVDGAYCGSVIFSNRYKNLIKGLTGVNSFSFNAHKMIGTPLTCSLLLVKDKAQLYRSFSNEASYLYQTETDEFNPGKTSLQCGRRNDALKFWALWKSVGTKGLEEIVDKQFALADVARKYIKNHPDYELHSFEDSISICFSYKGTDAKTLCRELYENNTLLVSYGERKTQDFVRMVTINAQNDEKDILDFFKLLEQFVQENKSAQSAPSISEPQDV
jgi:sulfinoalanine decarboxylase/sulfinoalanine decarboxylase/aspartate 1-decarboxylase